jgi:hypothetical protein
MNPKMKSLIFVYNIFMESKINEATPNANEYPLLNWQEAQTRFQLVLVKAGLCKVSSISIYPPFINDGTDELKPGEIEQAKVDNTVNELVRLGFRARSSVTDDGSALIEFANTEAELQEIEKLRQENNYDSQTQGDIYGIPQTAIEAFPHNVFSPNEIPKEITSNPLSELLPFLPSKEHYASEWRAFITQATSAASDNPELIHTLNLQQYFM